MHVLGADRRSFLFKVPEGRVFGEAVALRKIEVCVSGLLPAATGVMPVDGLL